jgi:hypothetical protein
MLEFLLLVFKGFLLGWFIVDFPLFYVFVKLILDFTIKNEKIVKLLIKPFECYKCAAFWGTLIMSGNIWAALVASFLIFIWDQKYNYVEI